MTYFSDITFLAAEEAPHCTARIDTRFEGMFNLQYIAAGEMYFRVNNGLTTILGPGSVFWHDPAHRYQYGPAQGRREWHHLWTTFRGLRAERLIREGFAPLSETGWLVPSDAGRFLETFRGLIEIVNLRHPEPHARAVLLLEELLLLAQAEETNQSREASRKGQLRRLAEDIRRRPLEAWDWRVEARRMHTSESHFRRLFRDTLGRSVYDYILEQRLLACAGLLTDHSLRIQQIADRAGYGPVEFSKAFKKRFGMAPLQFRNAHPHAVQSSRVLRAGSFARGAIAHKRTPDGF